MLDDNTLGRPLASDSSDHRSCRVQSVCILPVPPLTAPRPTRVQQQQAQTIVNKLKTTKWRNNHFSR